MIVARLIDTEGVTVTNMALPDPPGDPRRCVYTVAAMKINWCKAEELEPTCPAMKTIEYRLERRDGGGTYIYRRVTPPWG